TLYYFPCQLIGSPKVFIGSKNITFFQSMPDLGRTHTYMIYILTRNFFHLKAILIGIFIKILKATFAVLTKAVVITYYQISGSNFFYQYLPDKRIGAELRKVFGNGNAHYLVNAQFFKVLYLLFKGRQQLQGVIIRIQDQTGVWPESND